MKFSLALPDGEEEAPIVKAKLPISIFNQPFTSIFTSTTAPTSPDSVSDISFSLSTNFPSGPSLRLTYSPTPNPSSFPLSLSLKSGLGVFGSPKDSPLTFSAGFSVSKASPCGGIIPTFSLHFKPQLGQFSLLKRTASCGQDASFGPHLQGETGVAGNGSASSSELGSRFGSDGSSGWQEVKLEAFGVKEKDGLMLDEKKRAPCNGSGGSIKVRTELPLNKRVLVSFRWGVHLPGCFDTKLPYLTVNKFGIETVVEVEEGEEVKGKGGTGKERDLELLKGVCFWMGRDLELLEKENMEMKRSLMDIIRMGHDARGGSNAVVKKGAPGSSGSEFEQWRIDSNARGGSNAVGKKLPPVSSGSNSSSSNKVGEFEQWRTSKSDGEASARREPRKPANQVTDLESELQKAIKAASS